MHALRSRKPNATARRVRTALALVVLLLAAVVWWMGRGFAPTADADDDVLATSSAVSGSTKPSSPEPELDLESRTRVASAAPAEHVVESVAPSTLDRSCATIEVRVTVGSRAEEVSNFPCRIVRLSDSAVFRAQAIGPLLSYCLALGDAGRDDVIVSVSDDRFGTASQRASVSNGRRVQVHLRLPGNGRLRGLVIDEHRKPVAEAWVYSGPRHRMQKEEATELFEPLQIDRVGDAVITDGDGAFELRVQHECVTAWHPRQTTVSVPVDEATCIAMHTRGELRLQILDDTAQPWVRDTITLEDGRFDTTDLLGRVIFKDVELGVRGVTLPNRRVVGVVFSAASEAEIQVGPWLTDVPLPDPRVLHDLRGAEGSGVLVGLDGAFSVISLRIHARDLVIDAILPGAYLLVTSDGSFTTLFVQPDGVVRVAPAEMRTMLRVEAPAGARVYVAPERAHELLERACLLVTGQRVRGRNEVIWPSMPYGRWRVMVEGACDATIVELKERGQTVVLK